MMKRIAGLQVFILILSIFAFGFFISELNAVSALPSSQLPYDVARYQSDSSGNLLLNGRPVLTSGGSPVTTSGFEEFVSSGGSSAAAVDSALKYTTGNPYKPYGVDILPEFLATGPQAHLVQGFVWAATAFMISQFIGSAFGLDDAQTKSLSYAAASAAFAAKFVPFAQESNFLPSLFGEGKLLGNAGFTGLGVGIVVFLATYKEEKKEIVHYQCLPYEPPLGGADCETCNDDELRPCSEYRCRSLGQACELVNSGTTEEKCIWSSPNDVASPTITPWDEPLTSGHSYTSHDTRPPSLGTKIVKNDVSNGCIQAFTPLEFGIITNEPAQCKIDYVHTENFEEMQFFLGDTNYFLEEHEQRLSLPSPDSLNAEAASAGAPEIQNDGIYDLFVRCQDANGNENVEEYVFQFCVDPSPDTTPPVIVDTSIVAGGPVAFGSSETDLEVYVNEPAECKWSVDDKNYDDMENQMDCSSSVTEINAQELYTCETTLTGIQDRVENIYYFRCKDQPSKPDNERNTNVQSFVYGLQGTQELNILSVKPNETITGSTEVINVDLEVETSNGANEGESICYFSPTGEEGSFVSMFETNSFVHSQTLQLSPGDYDYHIRCVDAGGNSDETMTGFTVFTDTQAPSVTRAYRELDALKIVTDEDSECVYSLNSCNYVFDEGLPLILSNPSIETNHFVEWDPNRVYYVKCRDEFGNEPSPNACSIVASATNID